MPQFYYANPMFAAGVSNLAEALFPSPEEKVRMGLLGDQRRNLQAERRKLEAEALQQEIRNRETEAALSQLDATIGQLVSGLQVPTDDPRSHAARAAFGTVLRPGLAGGDKSSDLALALERIFGLSLAQGTEDQRRSARILHGGALDENFAGTTDRAEQVATRNLTAARDQAVDVANINAEADRYRTDVTDTRLREIAQLDDKRERDLHERGLKGNTGRGGGSRAPLDVDGKDLAAITEALLNHAATFVPSEGRKVEIDPALQSQLTARAAEIYQETRNLPTAIVQAFAEIVGSDPTYVQSGDFNPFAADRTRIVPHPTEAAPAAASPGKRRPLKEFHKPR